METPLAPHSGESTPQNSSEQLANPSGPVDLRSGLGFEAIEALRNRQRNAYLAARQEAADQGRSIDESTAIGLASSDLVSAEYIDALTVNSEGVDTAALRALINKYSFRNLRNDDWYSGNYDESGQRTKQSGIDLMGEEVKTFLETVPVSGKAESEKEEVSEEDAEVLKKWHEELDEMRENLAVLSAKRQGKLFGNGGDEYDKALDEYNTHLIALGKLENDKIINDADMLDEHKKVKITEYLFNEQKKLRELTTEKLKNTKVGRFVDKFTTFMKRGSKAMRVAKTIGLGLGLAGVGAAAGALTGGIAGAAIIAGGLIGAARFARSFAMADARYGRGMNAEPDGVKPLELMQNTEGEPDTYVDRLVTIFTQQFEHDTQNEQNKRRKSVGFALGTLAVGVVAGEAGHLIANGIADHAAEATQAAKAAAKAAAEAKAQAAAEHAQHVAEAAAAKAKAAAEAAAEAAANHLDPNYIVHPGEGGIELFEHAGLTEQNWYQIQNSLMEHFGPGHGDVFYQNPGEAVRIDHPGQLPLDVQQYIKNYFGK